MRCSRAEVRDERGITQFLQFASRVSGRVTNLPEHARLGPNGSDALFVQMIRWSMRPPGDESSYQVATNVKDGVVRVVVTAMDQDDEFLNFLNMSAVTIDPNMQSAQVEIRSPTQR